MTTSSSIKVKARRAADARPVGLLRLFIFLNEMTGFKIYSSSKKLCLFPATHRNLASPKSWLPTKKSAVMPWPDELV
jgi:hypothetical protein